MVEVEDAEDVKEVAVRDAFAAHVAERIRVDDLLAQRAGAKIWALGDVEDLGEGGFADCAAIDGPETAEDTEEGRFTTAIGTDNKDVITALHGEGEGFYEDAAAGCDDGPR